jgi:1,4-dihydroxy-2-naphthoate octaprenyltransferase
MSRFRRWVLAARPKTLTISLSSIIAGTALAWADYRVLDWPTAIATLAAALLIQIGTNLYNDAIDFERGTDTPARLGPERATAQGWFSAAEVKRAAHTCFGLASLIGIYLTWVGGWPIVAIGLLSLVAGYAYTAGPRPIAYSAQGELFVFLFFGLAAVLGSYYLQTRSISAGALFTACAIGALAAAVLLVNNYRDLDTDEKADKLTLVHSLGRRGSRVLYRLLLLLPFGLPLLLQGPSPGAWLVLAALPYALWLQFRFGRETSGPAFNQTLAATARLQLFYSLLLALGLAI